MFKNVNTEVSAAGKVTQSVKGIFGLSVWIRNTSEDVQAISQTLHGVLSAPSLTAWPSPAGTQCKHRGSGSSSAGTQDPLWAPASQSLLTGPNEGPQALQDSSSGSCSCEPYRQASKVKAGT